MVQALLTLFRKSNPLREMGEAFAEMLQRSRELTHEGGEVFFGGAPTPEELERMSKEDVKINKLQRRIRKRIVIHLSVAGNAVDLPYCLLLMNLVKDVERIGDYAKELGEARQLGPAVLPGDEIVAQLRSVRDHLEDVLERGSRLVLDSDREGAIELIRQGRELMDNTSHLLAEVAHRQYDPGAHAALLLGIQFYRRMIGHGLNVLSSVVVPLHKLDYYDEEDLLPKTAEPGPKKPAPQP
jgi:Na+/phosphate symporter